MAKLPTPPAPKHTRIWLGREDPKTKVVYPDANMALARRVNHKRKSSGKAVVGQS